MEFASTIKTISSVSVQMRACSGGHAEVAGILYKPNPAAIRVRNFYGETCFDLAARSSNPRLVETLEMLEKEDLSKAKSPAKKTSEEFAKPAANIMLRSDFESKIHK